MLNGLAGIITAQMVSRLLVVSYFVACALGLITGIDVSLMATQFLSETQALYLMRFIVLTLCGMVLFGVFRRPAALVLALIVFWTSYLSLYAGGEIGAFWRDLALIGGLLLTVNVARTGDMPEDWDDRLEAPESETDEISGSLRNEPEFRKDFNVARAS